MAMTGIQQTIDELNKMADFNNFGKTICRGCGNYFSGHSPDDSGISCEHCGTKNFTKRNEGCTIAEHIPESDGDSCLCGYFKKA